MPFKYYWHIIYLLCLSIWSKYTIWDSFNFRIDERIRYMCRVEGRIDIGNIRNSEVLPAVQLKNLLKIAFWNLDKKCRSSNSNKIMDGSYILKELLTLAMALFHNFFGGILLFTALLFISWSKIYLSLTRTVDMSSTTCTKRRGINSDSGVIFRTL